MVVPWKVLRTRNKESQSSVFNCTRHGLIAPDQPFRTQAQSLTAQT